MLYVFEDFALDMERRELRRNADLVLVEPQVFDLLVYLISNRERVVSRDDLIAAVWNGRIISEAALDSRINAARRAIRDSGQEQYCGACTASRLGRSTIGGDSAGSAFDRRSPIYEYERRH